MEEKTVPASQVEVWPQNLKTRATSKAGYERTKKQIEKLGVYKRLLCYQDGEKYLVLGGRTRYFILKERGDPQLDIAVVRPKSEAMKWEYCLSDNDHSGEWIELELLEETYSLKDEIELGIFQIDLNPATDLRKIIEGVGPSSEKKPKEETKTKCPECGHEW